MRLCLGSVSDLGFGVDRRAYLVRDPDGQDVVGSLQLKAQSDSQCLSIPDRETSRSLSLTLAGKPEKGRYRVRLDFCRRPFEDMPQKVVSNEVELVSVGSHN